MLVFQDGMDLPQFAAFDLLSISQGERRLREYFDDFVALALKGQRGLILESPTWRANADWGQKLGYRKEELAAINVRAIELLEDIRQSKQSASSKMVVSGCIGPRGDGYRPDSVMSIAEARDYHGEQIHTFAGTSADMVCALTLNYVEEAVGIALAAQDANIPAAISFTTETDSRLPTGMELKHAIQETDRATNGGPAYYMINCAHPEHFADALSSGEEWTGRLRGIRANASRKSHAELDECETLDRGSPEDLGKWYSDLRRSFPMLTVLGGCCGTDVEHVRSICQHC